MSLTKTQAEFVRLAHKVLERNTITRKDIAMLRNNHGASNPVWLTGDTKYKILRGEWKLPVDALTEFDKTKDETVTTPPKKEKYRETFMPSAATATQKIPSSEMGIRTVTDVKAGSYIPEKMSTFVSHGIYSDIKRIVDSRSFFPTFITGHKGLGKTIQIEQACAELGRDYFRVPITIETDEDDLLGGFRLIDGETVWFYGPVPIAMMIGAILNLDEIDKASNKIMCLQPVLEGRGIYLKKINKFITPAPGFNVMSTANTKGKGSDDGKYITSQVLDDSFLGRYAIMLEQEFPSEATEKKILMKNLENMRDLGTDPKHAKFVDNLVDWAEVIKKTHADGGCDEMVDTRGMVYVLRSYAIFGCDRIKAIRGYCSKFDDTTKLAFMRAYEALDSGTTTTSTPTPTNASGTPVNLAPF